MARLQDDAIGNADEQTLYVLIPDLHLISDDMLPRYSYHFNSWDNFYRMLFRIADTRTELASSGGRLSFVQLGDLFDLWRDGTHVPDHIIADNVNLTKQLYSYGSGLRASLLVGNHDAEMVGAPSWFVRLFLPAEAAGAFCFAVHGDCFDPGETERPEWFNRFFVYLGGRLPQANTYPVGEVLDVLKKEAAERDDFRDYIRLPQPAPLAELQLLNEPGQDLVVDLPDEVNVRRKSRPGDTVHEYLTAAAQVIRRSRSIPDASPAWATTRLVVIGHTHHARISVDDAADPRVVLMDCGAWIEKYEDSSGAMFSNCQIGAVCGNDLRIYQLDPV